MKPLGYSLIVSLLLSACAQTSPKVESQAPVAPAPAVAAQLVLPNIELTDALLYEILLTDIASQRGHKALAAEGSADLTSKTRDPRIAKRAAQLALESGDMNKAVVALRQWRELEPTSPLAGRMLATILLRGGKLDEAQAELALVLQGSEDQGGARFVQLFQLVAGYPDKTAVLKLMRNLTEPYSQVAEARWALAQTAVLANDNALGLSEVKAARGLNPEWDMAVSLEAQLLLKTEPKQALELLQRYLERHADARDIRLQYARALLEQKQYQAAREQFQRLSKENPESAELAFAIALISLQMNDLKGAETQLQEALSKGNQNQDAVRYYLAQLSEAKENSAEAIARYREVQGGEHYFPSRLRVAHLLAKSDKLDEAQRVLHETEAANNQQRAQLVMYEAQLLREAMRAEEGYQVLQQGLLKLPNHTDLLYETAMAADKLEKYEAAEQLLRKLMQLKPDHAHAYNALGYSFLARNVRIEEGVQLVEKALQLAPNDIAIMDSVGWGYFRSGKLDDSIAMLRKAYASNPDPEIATHLAEVLWAKGDKEEANKLLRDSLKANPDNALLQATIKKLAGQ
ncbi:MAG: tetratricopeptide repeat protein [Gallionella sp.]|nr:tetratricopeptide repeat protein [Gallionella sp.]